MRWRRIAQDIGACLDLALVARPDVNIQGRERHQGAATYRRDRITRIVPVDILRFLTWEFARKHAISRRSIGPPVTVQVVGTKLGSMQRSVVFLTPLVNPHHINACV
jgi:hypothetical protein